MGSLVVAEMIARYNPPIENIVSLSGPFQSAIKTYLAATGGEQFVPFVSAKNTPAMRANWDSTYDLLPQWQFVTRLDSSQPQLQEIF